MIVFTSTYTLCTSILEFYGIKIRPLGLARISI
nr:MAG TPA: hypothetical protein [Caudoviricetes sp.]DAU15041.1 MAG TPA: hypothetical protein [Caudoviricetes sp.]